MALLMLFPHRSVANVGEFLVRSTKRSSTGARTIDQELTTLRLIINQDRIDVLKGATYDTRLFAMVPGSIHD